ncbi:POTRA domain-containing protein, partial [Aeromonas hydrophila]
MQLLVGKVVVKITKRFNNNGLSPSSALVLAHCRLFLLCIQCANAAGPLSSPLDQNDVEQRQRGLLEEAARQRDDVARQTQLPAATATPTPEAAGPCFVVTAIRFEGADQLDADARTTLTSPFLHTCMGLPHINALIRDVSQWYLA